MQPKGDAAFGGAAAFMVKNRHFPVLLSAKYIPTFIVLFYNDMACFFINNSWNILFVVFYLLSFKE